MNSSTNDQPSLSLSDRKELEKLVNAVAMSDRTLTLFAIAPESAPHHPVVQHLKAQLGELDEPLQFLTFHYSDNSLFNFLAKLDDRSPPGSGRRVILAFGLEKLPTPRLKQEMGQLNLGREAIADRNLVLVFWLNRASFLDEFRRRAPDFWDWRGKVAMFEARPPVNPLLYPYLEWLIAENSYLRMSGVMQVNRQVDIFLDQIYVSLQAEWVEERSQSFRERVTTGKRHVRPSRVSSHKRGEPDGLEMGLEAEPMLPEMSAASVSRQRVTKIVDLAEAVRKHDYAVILGDPGAGKTTLLRYLARHFAIAHRDGNSTVLGGMQEELGQVRLPILFRIADYAERLAKQPDLSLVDYLKQFYRQWEGASESSDGDAVANLLLDKMAVGNCLLLLDGLDEVFDRSSRVQVVQQINRLVDEYRTNKFVITSRIAGYQEAALGNRFREFTITPMETPQIQQFLERWCLAVEVAQRPDADVSRHQRDAEQEAKGILDAIETKPGVKRFAANPLLLTILALIHRNGTQLPQRRVELYELATKTLIEDWQLGRNVPYGARKRQLMLVEEEVTALLAPLAFRMHEEKPSGQVTQAEVEKWLTPKMAEQQGVDESTALELVRQFLRKVRETTGLFVERAPEVYGFMHLTFEEYFTARYIADNEIRDILALIEQHWHEPRWEEPILLALGYYGSHSPKLLNKLLEQFFADLNRYQPIVKKSDIRIRHSSSQGNILVFSVLGGESKVRQEASKNTLQKLLLAGKVLSQTELNSRIRAKLVEKLVLTYIGLPELCFNETENETESQILALLCQIESFKQTGEVRECLVKLSNDPLLPAWKKMKVRLAQLHLACDLTGQELINALTEVVTQVDPFWFGFFMRICMGGNWGSEISQALEAIQDKDIEQSHQINIDFIKALSYLRKEHIDKAITLLEKLSKQENPFNPMITWALASCYSQKNEYYRALNYYQKAFEQLNSYPNQNALCCFWQWWALSYSSVERYRETLECLERSLAHAQNMDWKNGCLFLQENIAKTYQCWQKYELTVEYFKKVRSLYGEIGCDLLTAKVENELGKTFQYWGKYEQAIAHHQQSREFYEQLGKETNVANQWYWIGDCYRDWGKYQQALEAQQQDLAIRQRLADQPNIADAYRQLGRIYQAWGKYEQAIIHYQQSRQLYEHLGKETDVANQWYNLAGCYREWGKYQQALEAQQQDLAFRQKLDEQSNIADAYYQLGRIYQHWGKCEQAIAHHQHSRQLYEHLGKETNFANHHQWYWIGREWSKYEQALEAQQQDLAFRQKLDEQSNIADAYRQLGRIYQAWGKYEQAIVHYQQSQELYEQLGRETNVANQWYNLAGCYRQWGKYQQALEAEQQDLAISQRLDDQKYIADAYYQLGRIYQDWGKYEQAIAHYQQSRELCETLDLQQKVAYQLSWLAACYRDSKDYTTAIEYYQNSFERHQALGHNESAARRLRQLSNTQRLLAKNRPREEATALLQQAEHHLQQAIQLDTAGDYRENLAYDRIALALLSAEHLRWLPKDDPSVPDRITQFEQSYTTGFADFTELGQTVDSAEEALDIARAYLEIRPLENLNRAETLARQSLQTFQDFNRPKLEASACKLLGEIYLTRAHRQESGATATATQFFTASLHRYRELDLPEKAAEVEQLMSDLKPSNPLDC
jgi:tetratricopeptide (TPR) repeat protein/energy-coupling factor transporter ATP-binding protein EcfA2